MNPTPENIGMQKPMNRRAAVLRQLLVTSGAVRDPVIILTLLGSLSRASLMFAINETARTVSDGLGWSVVLLAVSAAAMLLVGHLTRIRAHRLIIRVKETMRLRMSRALLRANIDFLLSSSHGQVFSAMTSEVDEFSGAIINVIEAIEAIVIVCIAVPYLFWISPAAAMITVAAVSLGGIGYLVFDRPARKQMRLSSRARAEFCDRVSDMLAGWKEVRLRDTRRLALETETQKVIGHIGKSANRAEEMYSMSTAFGQAAVVLMLCFVVVVVPMLPGGNAALMFQILTVLFLTSGPIELLFNSLPRLSRAENAFFRIEVVEAQLLRMQSPALQGEIVPRKKFQSLELRDVTASVGEHGNQDSDPFVIGPINLRFEPGETVFICGGNGSGKTTLLSLISGLRNPESGEFLLDGVPMDAESRASFRELFSGVFSGFHLFDRTFGLTEQEETALQERIVELKLSDRVSLHEGRFSTLSLSAGQKRRLALAVALAESRPIIILDEFAADQDPANRAYFYDTLVPELAASGQLVIAVTHDDHQFEKCDRLIKMEGGQIVSNVRLKPKKPAETV